MRRQAIVVDRVCTNVRWPRRNIQCHLVGGTAIQYLMGTSLAPPLYTPQVLFPLASTHRGKGRLLSGRQTLNTTPSQSIRRGGGRGREAGRSEYTGRGVGWRAAAAAAVGLCGNGGVGNTSSCGIRDAGEPLAPALPAGAPQLAGAHRDSVADGGGLRRRRPSHLIGRDPQRYHQLSGWAASRQRTSVESLILVLNHVDKTILWSYYDPCQGANNGGVLGDDVHSPPRRSAGPE